MAVVDDASAQIADRLLDRNLALPDLAGSLPPPASELTVVVPVRDRPDELDRCLRSLAGLTRIVVDDASVAPRGADVVRRHGATLVALDHYAGPAAARNIGLNRAHTPYVAFVDSDVEVSVEVLLAMLRHFCRPSSCPRGTASPGEDTERPATMVRAVRGA